RTGLSVRGTMFSLVTQRPGRFKHPGHFLWQTSSLPLTAGGGGVDNPAPNGIGRSKGLDRRHHNGREAEE
ncbi:MAG: hypothetical protein AABP62_13315, partial [Planctomycetota bacterium]